MSKQGKLAYERAKKLLKHDPQKRSMVSLQETALWDVTNAIEKARALYEKYDATGDGTDKMNALLIVAKCFRAKLHSRADEVMPDILEG